MKKARAILVYAVATLTLIVNMAACTNDAADTAGPAPTSRVPTATVFSPEDKNNEQVGTANYKLTVAAVEDPAKPSAAYKQKLADSRLIAVQVTLENVQSNDALDVSADNLKLLNDKSRAFDAIAGAHDDELKAGKLKKGEKVTAWVAYEVPKDAKVIKVRYTVGLLATVQLEAPLPSK